ncbi:hypothetical protein JCM11641_003047 [Rhodosporidiobolus odoratus]
MDGQSRTASKLDVETAHLGHNHDNDKIAVSATASTTVKEAVVSPATLYPPPRRQSTRRKHRSKRVFAKTWQAASFHFTLSMTFAAIALVWSITPLSWGYVLWTAFSQLGPASRRPAPPNSPSAYVVLHYLTLAYTSCEVIFSVYYRYLAIKAQKLRPAPRHDRKFLRSLILRGLENGLSIEDELEEEEREAAEAKAGAKAKEKRRGGRRGPDRDKVLGEEEWQEQARDEEEAARGSDSEPSPWQKMRRRANLGSGDGAVTPEIRAAELPIETGGDFFAAKPLSSIPTLRTDDPARLQPSPSRASIDSRDEGYGGDSPIARAGGERSASRLSLRTLDSAIAASPRSQHAPELPKALSSISPSHAQSKHDHPYSPFLSDRLTPTDPRALDFRSTFSYWFSGAKWEDLQALNVEDWFAWSLYGEPLEQLEKERKEWDKAGRPPLYCVDGVTLDNDSDLEDDKAGGATVDEGAPRARRHALSIEGDKLGLVNHCLSLIEARSAYRFPPGRNPKVRATRLTLDPVRVTSRPLILYGFVSALQNAIVQKAKFKGFKEERDGDVDYLVYVPVGWKPKEDPEEKERPLVFIHGLGMGMAQYATLVHVLSTSPSLHDRPILVLLQPHISMSFFKRGYLDPPDQKRCTDGLERVLRKFGFDEKAGGCTVLSHSNGTIVHGWLVRDCPSLVARSCFVDAVCFKLWEPWVCHNFLVRKPQKPIEHLMRYFVSRELGVALMLSRTFQWTANLLFPHQIPSVSNPQKTAIFLASEDSILNAPRLRAYLRRNGLTEARGTERVGQKAGGGGLKVFKGLKHGESMIGEGAPFEEIMGWVSWDAREATAYSSSSSSGEESG